MRKGKNLTFLVTVLYTLALLMSLFSITPFAASATADDTTNKVTATTTTTVKQGDTVNCYVYIDSLESLSSLNVAVHFDPDKVSVTSSFNSASCALYDSSINESYVQFSYIFDGNGEATKTQLFYFQYKVLTNAAEGAAHFDVVVSEAYDSSLNVANISGSRCPFTIANRVTSKTCTVYGTSPVSTAIKEEFELSYRLNTRGVASGSFVIRYDADIFEFIDLSVGGLLANKFYDIKTDQPGIIYVSFVGTEYASNAQLLTVKFKTIRNATQSSQIKLSVTDFYDLELNSIGCNGYTTNVNLTYDPTYSDDAPTMTVSTVYFAEKQQVTVTIKLDAGSYLGAGDFVLNFNTEYFTYNSATKGFVPTFFNINDKKASEGIVKFSIISMSDIMTEETVLTVILDTPVFCNDVIADFDLSGSGLADSMTNPILINFVDSSLSISGVGHDLISHPAQTPTCTEIGWYAYATCSRCDYTTYEEIPANGHSYVHTICSVCDEKQPVFRSWDVSATGDGSVMANLYENVADGGYELEIVGTGAMMDWTSTSNVPWYNAYRNQINYLIIEDGITSIGARAFYGCTALTSAIIPNNVETIGYSAFYGCNNLSSVTFGTSVKTVGNYAFYGCNSLASAVLPNSVETIGEYAFYNCTSMSELSLGTSVATIGTYAFGNCSALTSVTIPESVTTIGTSAFVNCYLLNEINFNASAMNDLAYNNNVFFNAGINGEGIAVTIGANVTKVPAYLFYATSNSTSYLPKITLVEFEEGSVCESIGSYAFYCSSKLLRVMIPDTVSEIGTYAFYGCSKAVIGFEADTLPTTGSSWYSSEATYYLNAKQFVAINEALYVILNDNTATFAKYYGEATEYQVLDAVEGVTVTAIGANAFRNNTKIEYVTIPETVVHINASAFYGCSALKNFTMPSNLLTIGSNAFYGCSALTSVLLPETVNNIGAGAFNSCNKLTIGFASATQSATLGSSWSGDSGYYYNIKEFVVYDDATYAITNDNTAILGRYYGTATEYAILESVNGATVTIVGKSAFRNVTALIDVSIPDSVTRIEGSAFYNCTSLESITIPQYVTYIGNYAFYNTRALTEINFNAIDVTDLSSSNYVFYCAGQNGEGIKVTIGAQVTKIPNYLFYPYSTTSYLPKITEFTFEEGSVCKIIGSYTFAYNTNLTNIVLPEGVEVIRSYAFANTNITNIIIPNSVYNIQSNAFRNCTSLVSVHMPSALTTIGSEAFYGCTALTEIVIPEGVTSIGSSAFCNCKSLTQITFNAVAANDLGTNNYVFYNAGIDGEGITVLIGKDVTRIPSYIFYPYYSSTTYNPKVTRVIFEDDSACTTIGSYAFYSCSGITEIVIPEKITSINSSAFQNVGLKLVYICSDRIASNVSSASSYGYLLDGVSTVVIRSGIGRVNAYISDNFVNTEAITYQGVDYISYSVHVHSWTEHEVLIPFIACEQDGCIRYICSDCGAFKDVTTFRHDVIVNDAKEPTCLNVGWYEYHTCSRCDYTTYVEIPALGHRVLVDGRIWVDSITFENDANYPFTLQDGIYSSTNHSDNTDAYFTITALYDCTLNISYAISSEQNYDKIIVRVNGSTVVEISGQVDWTSKTIELNAGDIVTVNYHKDTSASVGEDTGWFSFTCEQTEIGSLVPGPAEEAEPTCTEAVVCHYCQTVVKEALGHDEVHHSAQTQTCTDIGWHAYDTCSRCDYTTYVEIPANGHSYGDWEIILDPTCTKIGTERRDCEVCDHYETRDIVALGHDEINHLAQAPTCTEIGWHAYVTCSRCDYTTYEEIPANGHSMDSWFVAQAPTCTVIGAERRNCNNCDHYETRVIEALGHDEIAHPAKAPTCTEIGWYAYDTCSRCDYTTYVERAVLGHDTINHEAQAPTCTEIGWYAYDTCSRCTYTTYVEIAATGHNYVRTNCSVCGNAQPTINTWDISADGSGNLIAKIYHNYVEGGYELVISGSGAMADYEYNEPWSNYRGSITRVELPDGITSIGSFAFYGCTSLRQITIPESVELIGEYAFAYSGNLVIAFESNKLPSVNGSYWDQSCSYYLSPQKIIVTDDATYVIDSDGNASLAKYVGNATEFVAWETVEGITLTGIGQYAFYNKDNLHTYWIADNISYIGREAFYGCKGLAIMMESSEFPSYIGSSWNGGCSYYLGAETWIENDFLFVRDKDNKVDLIRYQGTSEEVTVPAQAGVYPIQSIRQYAFYRSTVKTIIVSEGIQIIGNEAFSGCSYLQSIQLPQSLLKIGSYAFRDCSSLQEIQLPQNLTSIGNDVFWGCSKIKSMVIPQGVTVLDGTFVNCYELESVTLHDGITQLGGMTFYGCHSLKEIQLPKKLSSLGYYTFYNCYALNTIEFLENIHSINWSTAFVGTKIDVMYIRSSRLAASITESAWSAEIFQTLKTIVVPAGSGTTYLQSIFTHCETIYRDGVAYDVYSLNAHSWQSEVIEEYAVCQNDGVILFTCENCGVEKLEITPCHDKVNHEAKAPSCTEIGWNTYETCSRCDYTTYVEIPANGHSYGNWEVILDPTCTAVGTERRDCDNCDHYETRDIAALGHDLLHHSAKEVTCTNIGWNAFDTCSRCDYTTYVEIPAMGHTSTDWIIDEEATYEADGSKHKECTVCHEVIETATIPKKPAFTVSGAVTSFGSETDTIKIELIPEGETEVAYTTSVTGNSTSYSISNVAAGTYILKVSKANHLVAEKTVTILDSDVTENVALVLGNNGKQFKINSAYLVLSQDINVIYRTTLPAGFTDPRMVFEFNGEQIVVTEYTVDGQGRYCYAFPNVNPQKMGDNICATLYATVDGTEVSVSVPNYSVRQYCVNQLKKNPDDNLKRMISDLLVYGEKTQIYQNYKTDALVTDGLELTPSIFEKLDSSYNKLQLIGTADLNIKYSSASLELSNDMIVLLGITTKDPTPYTFEVTTNGKTEVYSAEDLTYRNGKYYLSINGVKATKFNDVITAVIKKDGVQIGQTLKYSVNTYIQKNQNTTNTILGDLLKAIYNYGESAKLYEQ